MRVNAETLHDKIERLEGFQREHIISLDGEYQLKAYKMLLKMLTACEHEYYAPVEGMLQQCTKCGEVK